jgi:hypothetical protein
MYVLIYPQMPDVNPNPFFSEKKKKKRRKRKRKTERHSSA